MTLIQFLIYGLVLIVACDGPTTGTEGGQTATEIPVPLTDLGAGTYLGFEGGLYPGGANAPPADHAAEGARRSARIEPLDRSGAPAPEGRIVLLSVGMSNTTQEFCSGPVTACAPWSFAGQATADAVVDRAVLAIVDGALGGHDAEEWDDPADPAYDRVRDTRLAPLGLTEAQVQAVWLKQANARPTSSLPAADADAFQLQSALGDVIRALAHRYPNLEQVFVSSRTYGGYATTSLNPEPYAFETGFAVKWLIEAQIEQGRSGAVDVGAGDLDPGAAPWLAWGPYLWADGERPRSDGLVWQRGDFVGDGTHPSASGEEKVGALLLDFFSTAPAARCWFRSDVAC